MKLTKFVLNFQPTPNLTIKINVLFLDTKISKIFKKYQLVL